MHQIAMDIPEQINNLKEHHLIIEDEEEAARRLQKVSYYRLIKAYGIPFKNKASGNYRNDVTFDQIYRVYEFDNQLRLLLIPYLQEIEISFRCQITNTFCAKYGAIGYLDKNNFDETADYDDLLLKIRRCLEQAKDSPIIKNFKENYIDGEAPLYAAVEVFTFGTLALFYRCMKKEDRIVIASQYEEVDERYLSSWLVSIAYVRNLCTHFNRLYLKELVKKPLLYKKQDRGVSRDRLFAVLCCMRFLFRGEGVWHSFVNSLEDLFDEYSDCVKPSGIGCVDLWKEKLLDLEPNNPFSILIQNSK